MSKKILFIILILFSTSVFASSQSTLKIDQSYIADEIDFTVTELKQGIFQVDWQWKNETIKEIKKITKIEIKENRKLGLKDKSIFKNVTKFLYDEFNSSQIIGNYSVIERKKLYQSIPINELCKTGEVANESGYVLYNVYDDNCNLDKYQDKIIDDILKLKTYPTKNSKVNVKSDYDFSGDFGSFTFNVPYNIFGYTIYGKLFDLGFGTATFTLTDPDDGRITNDNTPPFEFKVEGNVTTYSVELFLNSTSYGINNSVLNDTTTIITANDTLVDGLWNWYLTANSSSDGIYNSTLRTITIDTIEPQIDFISPTPPNNSIEQDAITVNLNMSDANNFSAFVDFNNSLVGWWRMDDYNSTDVLDYTDNNNDGSIEGDASYTSAGKMGGAFEFDGVGDYVLINDSDSLDIGGQITITAWVKSAGNSQADGGIVTKYQDSAGADGWALQIGTNPISHFRLDDGSTSQIISDASTPLDDNVWHYMVGTYNGSDMRLYMDATLKGSATVTINSGAFNTSFPVRIGEDEGLHNSNFNGLIDDVLIFSRALEPNEIKSLYNAKANSYENKFTDNLTDTTYRGWVQDTGGNVNSTELRTVTINNSNPFTNFTAGTPADASSQTADSIFVNVTGTDNGNISTFIDFDNSLVSWWRMDDYNSTDVIDYTGRNNGTINGDASYTSAGKMGGAFEFDGDRDYVDCGNDGSLDLDELTYSAWIKTAFTSADDTVGARIVSNLRALDSTKSTIRTQADYAVFSWHTGSSFLSAKGTTIVTDDLWHHIVGVHNGTDGLVYVDGILDAKSVNGMTSLNYNQTYISTYNRLDGEWNGSIDDVMIFNRSLSANEIANMYANQSTNYLEVNFTGLSDGAHSFKAYSQDYAGNVNATGERSVSVDATTCTYDGSGDWNVDCSDDCQITTVVNILGNNVIINGTGTFTFNTTIHNYSNFTIRGTDSSNICEVTYYE